MDERMLNDLLECSVCLERLDTSSKVLPCQHTFCKKCLDEIVSTKKELRCPECRVLVECRVEILPPNVLLMRILEGMRNAGPKKQRAPAPNCIGIQNVTGTTHPVQQLQATQPHAVAVSPPEVIRTQCTPKQTLLPNQPCARAIYDYLSNEQGDLKFKKGDIILLRKKMDMNWYHGEIGGKQGVFPLSYVQVITPLPCHIPQCKALYDFRMTNDDEEGCLTFNKGEVITVIRRVDENWAEGKLTDRIGIFPLAFVELNNVARALMKLSSNSQPGPSRLAPPTPTSEDMTPLIPTDHSRTVATAQVSTGTPVHNISHHHITMGVSQDSSSTVSSSSSSSTTPNTPSSNTSSSSSTAPSSPASPPPRPSQPPQNTTSPPPRPTYNPALSPPRVAAGAVSPPHGNQSAQLAQNRGKRHSFSSVLHTGSHQQTSHRHSAEILTPTESPPQDGAANESSPQSLGSEVANSQRHRRSGSSDMAACPPPGPHLGSHQNTPLPAPYIALYPYKPQKTDEMELRKGAIYMVTEQCQDGWFKGTSNRTQKGGVFPGNYVAPTKQVSGSSQLRSGVSRSSTSPSSPLQSSPRTNGASPESTQTGLLRSRQQTGSPAYSPRQQSNQPPELPPRSSSPSVNNTHHASPISTSWHGQPQEAATGQTQVPLGRSQSAVMPSGTSQLAGHMTASVTPPPNVAISSRSSEKVKERKEKGVSLMRRLTSIKKSKSPPPLTSYSMDNPVFEDGSVSLTPSHPVHVRSGSCPSQLLQVLPLDGTTAHHRLFGSGSQRLKHKTERPHVVMVNTTYFSRPTETTSATGATSVNQHRKSNSLDAGSGDTARKASKPAAPPVRERFRCIVPYPPNSEYELELRVGDIIYVHRKREDGWYKGTQQRTGRTGLFPASFVETF